MSLDPRLLLLRARAVCLLADVEKAAKKGGKFDSAKHPRYPAGNPKGGQFRPKLGTGSGGAEIFMPVYTGSNKIIQAFEAATLAVANQMAQGVMTGAQKLLGMKTHPDDTNNTKLKSTVRQLAAGTAKPDVVATVVNPATVNQPPTVKRKGMASNPYVARPHSKFFPPPSATDSPHYQAGQAVFNETVGKIVIDAGSAASVKLPKVDTTIGELLQTAEGRMGLETILNSDAAKVQEVRNAVFNRLATETTVGKAVQINNKDPNNKAMRAAEKHIVALSEKLPAAWTGTAVNLYRQKEIGNNRAGYDSKKASILLGNAHVSHNTLSPTHELVHHLQHTVTGLNAPFAMEHHRRTANTDAVVFSGKEKSKPDRYAAVYAGREYGIVTSGVNGVKVGSAKEVMSKAMEGLLDTAGNMKGNHSLAKVLTRDPVMFMTALGVMYGHRVKETPEQTEARANAYLKTKPPLITTMAANLPDIFAKPDTLATAATSAVTTPTPTVTPAITSANVSAKLSEIFPNHNQYQETVANPSSMIGRYGVVGKLDSDTLNNIVAASHAIEDVSFSNKKLDIENLHQKSWESVGQLDITKEFALREYTGASFVKVNENMMSGNPSAKNKNAIAGAEAAVIQLPSGTILGRGHDVDSPATIQKLLDSKGTVLQDIAISSTDYGSGWNGKDVKIRYKALPGAKGLYMGVIPGKKSESLSYVGAENEMLLSPKSRMLVTRVENKNYDPNYWSDDSAKVYMDVLLLPENDAGSTLDTLNGVTTATALKPTSSSVTPATPKPADAASVAPTTATPAPKKPTPFFADNVQLWHGAGQSFKAFDSTKIGTGADAGTANWYGAGFYLSGEPWKAKSYADATGSQGQIASVKTTIENPLKINGTGASDKIDALKAIGIEPTLDGPALTSALQDKGYDGVVVYKNGSEKINEVVVFNADQASIQDWQPAIPKPVSSPATVSVAATPATVAPTAGALGDPPKIASASNPQYQKKIDGLYASVKAGDTGVLDAFISLQQAKVDAAKLKPTQNAHDKWNTQLLTAALELKAKAVGAKIDATVTAATTPAVKPVVTPVATPAVALPVKPVTDANSAKAYFVGKIEAFGQQGLSGSATDKLIATQSLKSYLKSGNAEVTAYAQAWLDHLDANGTPAAQPPTMKPVLAITPAAVKPVATPVAAVPVKPDTTGNWSATASIQTIDNMVNGKGYKQENALINLNIVLLSATVPPEAKQYAQAWIDHLKVGGTATPVATPKPTPAPVVTATATAAVISAPKGIGSKTHAQYTKQGEAVYQSALAGDKAAVDAMVAQYQAKIDAAKLKPNYPTFADGQYNKLLAYSQKVQAEMQTAATAGLPATAPKSALTKTKLALADMTQVGGKPGGSNPGGVYQDADGAQWLVKGSNKPDPDGGPAKNEVLAARLYNAAGGFAPEMRTVDLGTQYGGGIGVASKMQDGFQSLDVNNPAHIAKVREDFAMDAWLANWDAVGMGMDNTVIDKNGNALRIDPGGSLLYRAQGTPKGADFGKAVNEWNTLRDPSKNPQAAKVFAGMTDSELKASAAKVAAISDSTIQALVSRFGPGDAAAKAALAETLIARKQDVIAKAGMLGAAAAVVTTPATPATKPVSASTPPVKPDISGLTSAQQGLFAVIDGVANKTGSYDTLSDAEKTQVLTLIANGTTGEITTSPQSKAYAQAWLDHLNAGGTATIAATTTPPTIKSALPNFASYKLEASNTNAPGINAKVDKIAALAQAGDVAGILALSYGSNTYAKKTVNLANDTLAALGSTEKVTAGQKAGTHPAIGGAGTATVKPTAAPAAKTPVQTLAADFKAMAAKLKDVDNDGGISTVTQVLDHYSVTDPGFVKTYLDVVATSNDYSPGVKAFAQKVLAMPDGVNALTAAWIAPDPNTPATHTGAWANQYGAGVGNLTTRVTALGAATAAKPNFDPAKLTPPPDYNNLNGPGKGLSSQPAKNAVSNQIAQELYVLAANGDLVALKNYDISAKVGGVKNTKTEEVVGMYRDQLIGQIENMLNPPPPITTWKIGGTVTPDNVSQTLQQAFPKYQQYQQTFQNKANMLGRWGIHGGLEQKALQKITAAADAIPAKQLDWASSELQTIYEQSYAQFNTLTAAEQKAIKDYTGGIYTTWNNQIANNKLSADVKVGMSAYEKASVELPAGLILSRKWDPPDGLKNQINNDLMGLTGKVVQDVAMISSSIDPDTWSGSVRMRIKTLPGARGFYVSKTANSSKYIGNHPSEKEIVLNSKTRFLVTKVSKTNYDKSFFEPGGKIFMDVLALPEDPAGSVLDSMGGVK